MRWLTSVSLGDQDADRVLILRPELRHAFGALCERLWETTADPVLLELCRLRLAQLLRCAPELAAREPRARDAGLSEERIAALAGYGSSPLFSDRERACLEYAERVCADPTGITDDELATVRGHLGETEFVRLTTALTVFEGLQRALLVLGVGVGVEVGSAEHWRRGPGATGSR